MRGKINIPKVLDRKIELISIICGGSIILLVILILLSILLYAII
jgi:hypothetical protein